SECLWAMVAECPNGRIYLNPSAEMVAIALSANPTWKPSGEMPQKHRNFQPPVYGMNTFGELFTRRQLVALTTFADLVGEAKEKIRVDALSHRFSNDERGIEQG